MSRTTGQDHRKFMWQGLYLDALRGMDSTGLATIDVNGELKINKKAMTAVDFLNLKQVEDQIDDYTNRVFIGHNRAATRGAVNNHNAHPFQHGKITMVHNGSLNKFSNLPDYKRFTVDSEAIAYSLDKIGTEETLKLLDGAFALVWWDDEAKKVNMVRNGLRPLHLASIEKENTIIWGSEPNMLRYVAGRAGLKIKDTWELPVKTLATFDPKSDDIWECDLEEMEFHTYSYNRTDAGFHRHNSWEEKDDKSREKTLKEDKERRNKAEKVIKARDERSEKMFKELGVQKGQRVKIFLYDFTPFNKDYPLTGVWEGCTTDDPYTTVVVYGCSSTDFEIGEEYVGSCLSMQPIDLANGYVLDHLYNYRLIISNQTIERFKNQNLKKPLTLEDKTIKFKETSLAEEAEAHKFGIDTVGMSPIQVRNALRRARNEKKSQGTKGDNKAKKPTITLPSGNIEVSHERDDTEAADIDILYIVGPRGTPITMDYWSELTKHGCGMCARDIPIEDSKLIEWWGEAKDSPVCSHCIEECAENAKRNLIH